MTEPDMDGEVGSRFNHPPLTAASTPPRVFLGCSYDNGVTYIQASTVLKNEMTQFRTFIFEFSNLVYKSISEVQRTQSQTGVRFISSGNICVAESASRLHRGIHIFMIEYNFDNSTTASDMIFNDVIYMP